MASSVQRFRQLFAGLDRVHGQYDIDQDLSSRKIKKVGKARTLAAEVTDKLYELHLAGEQGLGIVPIRDDSKCVFGAIDIDVYENFDLVALQADIVAKGLPLVLTRSKSGGAHCWLFMSEPIPAELIRKKLDEFAAALGHPGVEIFPKQAKMTPENTGNWINLPFFFAENTDRWGFDEKGTLIKDLGQWLDYAEKMRISKKELIAVKSEVEQVPFFDGPPCLQALAKIGFPDGSRNQALFNCGVYCRKKHPDDWEEELEAMNVSGLFKPPLASNEVQTVRKSLARKDYGYTCEMAPINAVCRKEQCFGRKYGIGGGDGGAEFEGMLGGLRRSVMYDMDGNEVEDDNVKWFLDVNGIEITLTTSELFSQDRLRMKCAERTRDIPPKMRPQRWDALLREKVKNADLIEFHLESGTFGRLVMAIKEFCQQYSHAEVKSDINQGLVWVDEDGIMHFRSDALWNYFLNQKLYTPRDDQKKVHIVLKQLGAESRRIQGNLLVWSLPGFPDEEKLKAKPPKEHF